MLRSTLAAFAASAVLVAPAFAEECAEPAQKPERAAAGEAAAGDSFSFGVEREMKESGEKGGTEDINIGIGELQEGPEAEDKPKRLATAETGERAMKESGEKGGTEDINIGVGELQECTTSESTDKS